MVEHDLKPHREAPLYGQVNGGRVWALFCKKLGGCASDGKLPDMLKIKFKGQIVEQFLLLFFVLRRIFYILPSFFLIFFIFKFHCIFRKEVKGGLFG